MASGLQEFGKSRVTRGWVLHVFTFWIQNRVSHSPPAMTIFPLPLPSNLAILIHIHIFPCRYMCKLAFFQNPLTSRVDQFLLPPIFGIYIEGGSGCRPRTNKEQIYRMPGNGGIPLRVHKSMFYLDNDCGRNIPLLVMWTFKNSPSHCNRGGCILTSFTAFEIHFLSKTFRMALIDR